MNIIIYTVVILTIFYFLLRLITNISSRKISKGLRFFIILGLFALAVLFAIGGKFLLTLPLTLASLALLKLKGLSIFQLISLFRLIQTLRRSGRFSFNQAGTNNQPLTNEINSFDQYAGHPQNQGVYHYHLEPTYLTSNKGQDALLGFLLDGFPVYGPFENDVKITNENLDEYHGHSHITPDYPNGIYHYHITDTDPYINGNGYYGSPGTVSQ